MSMRGNFVNFGSYGLKAMSLVGLRSTNRIFKNRNISYSEENRKNVDKDFPDKPVTARPAETRMGKEGFLDHWVALVKPGRILLRLMELLKKKQFKHLEMLDTSCQ